MEHEDLKQIGITAYGHRHKLIKGMEKIVSKHGKIKTYLLITVVKIIYKERFKSPKIFSYYMKLGTFKAVKFFSTMYHNLFIKKCFYQIEYLPIFSTSLLM